MSTSERTGVDLIEAAVVDVLGFSLQELRRQRRQREVVEARLVLIYLIRKMHPKATLMELGTYIGRSHATIIHYAIAHRNLCDEVLVASDLNLCFQRRMPRCFAVCVFCFYFHCVVI